MATKKRRQAVVPSAEKIRRFALAYMRCGVASLAYRQITPGCKANAATAKVQGWRLLHDERTQDTLQKLRERAAERATTSLAEWLANELKIARFDVGRMFDEDGNLIPLPAMDPDTRAAIQAIDIEEERVDVRKAKPADGPDAVEVVTRTRVKKIKVHSKDGAQDRLGKHLGAFREDNKQRNPYEELLALMNGKP